MIKRFLTTLGLVSAASAGIGALYAATDYLGVRPVLSREIEDVREIALAALSGVQLQRWQHLHAKAQRDSLTPSERVEYCELSRQLGLRGIGCA